MKHSDAVRAKDINRHLKKCECGGKRRVVLVIKKDESYLAECKDCNDQSVVNKIK